MEQEISRSDVGVNIFSGPIGSCGFRTGNWDITYKGKEYSMYSSIPHAMEIEDQRERLITGFISHVKSGRIVI